MWFYLVWCLFCLITFIFVKRFLNSSKGLEFPLQPYNMLIYSMKLAFLFPVPLGFLSYMVLPTMKRFSIITYSYLITLLSSSFSEFALAKKIGFKSCIIGNILCYCTCEYSFGMSSYLSPYSFQWELGCQCWSDIHSLQ